MYPSDTLFFSPLSETKLVNKKITIAGRSPAKKFFKESEIKSISPLGYKYIQRKKLIVHSPHEYVDKLTKALAKKGAGVIGNYNMCSFRIEGTGTYLPNKKARPHKGKPGELAKEEEVRLEMECDDKDLDNLIDTMLSEHPYEEVAYEIHDFTKRSNITDGIIIDLKKSITHSDLLKKLNKKLPENVSGKQIKLKRIVLIESEPNEFYKCKSVLNKAHALISVSKQINLIILK